MLIMFAFSFIKQNYVKSYKFCIIDMYFLLHVFLYLVGFNTVIMRNYVCSYSHKYNAKKKSIHREQEFRNAIYLLNFP